MEASWLELALKRTSEDGNCESDVRLLLEQYNSFSDVDDNDGSEVSKLLAQLRILADGGIGGKEVSLFSVK